ncbi:MAG: TrkH family potassium uptake protein, partial [Chthoniobacterales bacterium]|nr:TrkH family potassium uptake protein [Chthoniobacterales bacterium]
MNFRAICRNLGGLAFILTFAMSLCGLYGLFCTTSRSSFFDYSLQISTLISGLAAAILFFVGRKESQEILRKEAIATVGLGWLLATLLGALPYCFSSPSLTFAQALFESASGFTTTGSSAMENIETFPKEVLLWRATTQWLGGIGILVLFVALLSSARQSSKSLFQHESTIQLSQGIYSRIREMALRLWQIYSGLSAICILGLLLLGTSLYDAATFTFAAISTGGFAPYNASVAWFANPAIEIWLTIFMFAGGANFLLFTWLLHGRPTRIFKDEEFRLYLLLSLVATIIVFLSLLAKNNNNSLLKNLRDALFQCVSIMTTTGFSTADYNTWPPAAQAVLLALMFVGGCVGSTAGSVKVRRWLILGKALGRQVIHSFRPQQVLRVRLDGSILDEKSIADAIIYIAISLFLLLTSTVAIGIFDPNLNLAEAASACLTTFANVGPGFGSIGPTGNFANLSPPSLLLLAALMLLGRLELFALLALF